MNPEQDANGVDNPQQNVNWVDEHTTKCEQSTYSKVRCYLILQILQIQKKFFESQKNLPAGWAGNEE